MIEDKLNLTFYKGTDEYSDGDVEEEILEIVSGDEDYIDVLKGESSWPKLYHLSDVRHNLLRWYNFDPDGTALEIGAGCGAVTGLLCERLSKVTCIDLSKRRSLINATRNRSYDNLEIYVGNFTDITLDEKFDYVTLIGVLEYSIYYVGGDNPFDTMIKRASEYLKPGGKLIIAIENKYGLKYFAGAKEDHTGKLYDGIENYVGVERVRTFSRGGLIKLMEDNGFVNNDMYYPVPDYKMPVMVYSDDYLPQRGDIRHTERPLDQDRILLFNENLAFDSLCEDNMFHELSNSFLVISSKEGISELNKPIYADFHSYRKPEFQISTIVYKNNNGMHVEKKPINNKAHEYIKVLADNSTVISSVYNGISVVPVDLKDSILTYSYVDGCSLDKLISDKLNNLEELCDELSSYFARLMDYNDEAVVSFSKDLLPDFFSTYDLSGYEGTGCLRITNLSMDFEHIISLEGKLYGIGYEWVYEASVPNDFIKYHMLNKFYKKYQPYLDSLISEREFYGRFINDKYIDTFNYMELTHRELIYGRNEENIYIENYYKKSERLDTILSKANSVEDLQNMVKGVEAQRDSCLRYRLYYFYRKIRRVLHID